MRVLIANRGEIARRILRTAHRCGHETVAVWADPDRDAPHVREATHAVHLGPAALADSYLSVERLLDAAKRAGATAVHPGYGFLSENARFARAVVEAGLVWIGPHPEAIERMGSKIEARALAEAAGVPLIPGFAGSQDAAALARAAERIGFPVLVKAAAGGGGKGIRIVHAASELAAAIGAAAREAERSFGDASLIVERYVERARHVEVQVVGDRHGNVVDLGTRECSVQRRYQKLLEEAPAPNLPDATRSGLREAARELARSIRYDSAGTVEFVVDDATGEFFFLEMNTRLQVEHPVTEAVTGLDLVELQLRVAAGERLGLDQSDISLDGHAIEARIYAEDPSRGFLPQTGTVLGSPKYLSPEQVLGMPVDGRADIFALGTLLFEMLTGKTPFEKPEISVFSLMQAICTNQAPRITEIRRDLPVAFDTILNRALGKRPEERYQRASEFAVDLRNYKRFAEVSSEQTMMGRVDTTQIVRPAAPEAPLWG